MHKDGSGSGGRPKGALNYATRELKEYWHSFFISEEYRLSAERRMLEGRAPHLEAYLLNRIYGKPKESLELRVGPVEEDLSTFSSEELMLKAESLMLKLREAAVLEAAMAAASQTGCALPETVDVQTGDAIDVIAERVPEEVEPC